MKSFEFRVTLLWFFLFSGLVAYCFVLCGHHLIYSLDDAYIHLDLARNILHGNYGINAGESASPSSSVIWPWLLAATQLLGLGSAAPLVLNAAVAAATVYVSARLLRRLGLADEKTGFGMTLGMGLAVIFAASALALPMTGMEHTLQVLTVVLVMEGLIAVSEGAPPAPLFMAALVAMPLVRFEGMALFLAAAAALWLQGHRRAAVTAAGVLFCCLAAYEGLMIHLGLPMLPSSVLVKLCYDIVPAGKALSLRYIGGHDLIVYDLKRSFEAGLGKIYLGFLLYLIVMAFRQRKDPRRKYVYVPVICAIMAQLVCEKSEGLMARYAVYVIEMTFLTMCYSLSAMPALSARARRLLLLCLALPAVYLNVLAAFVTPAGAHAIYGQHYQMHRFVNDYYRGPVASSELGLLGYHNRNYVLDLWGLGSMDVYRLRSARAFNAAALDGLVKKHKVHLVMIFRRWFRHNTPQDWRLIGVLHVRKDIYGTPDMAFYATPGADRRRIVQDLRKFEPTLPKETKFLENAAYFKGA